MIVVQGFINVLGLIAGTSLIGQGNFVMAFFMSISAGTFLYISLAEVLFEQIKTMNKRKMFAILLANAFIALLVGF
jgi:zinc transporter ZupT